MKKYLVTAMLALLVAALATGTASAQKGKVNINGEVVSIEAGALAVRSNKGETFVVHLPDGFDASAIQVGAHVLIKGKAAPDGSIEAESIKLLGNGGDDDKGEEAEEARVHNAFCRDGAQDRPHPLAPKMAARYGVSEEWVMERFCEGYSMGAIMLALRTSQIEGITVTPEALLADRGEGRGWGLIWKELGLIGREKDGHSPPGWLKRPDHAGPK